MKAFFSSLVLLASLSLAAPSLADTFGSGANTFSIDFVTIGDPGNDPDTTGDPNPAGAVAYEYRIGKYEIPEDAINKANAQSALDGNPLGITIDARGPNKPATRASWFEAARFVNWLNTSTGSSPAYKFDTNGDFQLWEPGDAGYNPANKFRNTQARYFLPSADEWYKAAFFDPVSDTFFDFPNGSNTAPLPVASGTDPNTAVYDQPFAQGPADVMLAGGLGPFGTVGQAGNVWEIEETQMDLVNDDALGYRSVRGDTWFGAQGGNHSTLSSSFRNGLLGPGMPFGDIGFRVAGKEIPEPTTIYLASMGVILLAGRMGRPIANQLRP